MLELVDLHKRYGDVVALDGATFRVGPGQLIGFLGPNGAGKTTAMRAVFSLVQPDAGTVRWRGQSITRDVLLRFGYMPEQRGLYPKMRILEQLTYFGRLHGMSKSAATQAGTRWLAELGLGERLDSELEDLSHGNQQRVQLATALLHDPELLVLDEPFSGLDPIGVEAMSEILRSKADSGAAVVFSSHQLDLVEDICEDVVIINEGRIVLDGAVRELRARSNRRYLDVEVTGDDIPWDQVIPTARVLLEDGRRTRLEVDRGVDLGAVVSGLSGRTDIDHFSFEPPSLSEVFLEAVGA